MLLKLNFAILIIALYKTIVPFYIICFVLYVFFSRQPDFQDGEFTTGVIHFMNDSATKKPTAKAIFIVDKIQDTTNATYVFRNLKEGQTVPIIYETSNPKKAAVYFLWGYWLQWDELLASILIPFVLLYAAKAITASPTPEALLEEMEMRNPPKRRKYD